MRTGLDGHGHGLGRQAVQLGRAFRRVQGEREVSAGFADRLGEAAVHDGGFDAGLLTDLLEVS